MTQKIGSEAAIPNPILKPFQVLISRWNTEGTHAYIPGVSLRGKASFEWIEGGAFLLMRSEVDEPSIPSAVAIIGSDDVDDECFMLYFDERNISRKFNVTMSGNTIKWWRNAPSFAQRFTGTITDEGKTIVGKSELCQDGTNWETDLELTYTRSR